MTASLGKRIAVCETAPGETSIVTSARPIREGHSARSSRSLDDAAQADHREDHRHRRVGLGTPGSAARGVDPHAGTHTGHAQALIMPTTSRPRARPGLSVEHRYWLVVVRPST